MKLLIYSIQLALLVSVASTFAGTRVGNGGDAIVCRSATGAIESAELLDLFEGRVRYALSIEEDTLSDIQTQTKRALLKLKTMGVHRLTPFEGIGNTAAPLMSESLIQPETALSYLTPIPAGTRLERIPDANPLLLPRPRNCDIEQLAVMVTYNRILIDQEIYLALSPTHQAAFLLHEIVYRNFDSSLASMGYRAENSDNIRALVAYLFSNSNIETVDSHITDYQEHWLCETERRQDVESLAGPLTQFHLLSKNGTTRLQFMSLANEFVFGLSYVEFPFAFAMQPGAARDTGELITNTSSLIGTADPNTSTEIAVSFAKINEENFGGRGTLKEIEIHENRPGAPAVISIPVSCQRAR